MTVLVYLPAASAKHAASTRSLLAQLAELFISWSSVCVWGWVCMRRPI